VQLASLLYFVLRMTAAAIDDELLDIILICLFIFEPVVVEMSSMLRTVLFPG
jgi:hypothetical protein